MIVFKDVVLCRGAKQLLDRASVTINVGEKVGLIGHNGAGKSSLFALMNGSAQEESGEFLIPPAWRIAQVAQGMPESEMSITDYVLEGDTRLCAAQLAVQQAETSGDHDKLAHAFMELHDAGSMDAKSRAQTLILGLGFTPNQLEMTVNSFSGGWRMRLQLARALMCPSDLLLLDEPTNHLDLDALVWLENWLKRYDGTLMIISHDREFLDAITDVTIHIDREKLTRYGGNYSKFEELRAEHMLLQQAAFAKQQEKITHLQKFIDRFKAKATKAKQAQSRVKALERMEKIAPLLADSEFTFEFAPPKQLPNPMLSMKDLSVGYQTNNKEAEDIVIVRSINRSVLAGQRIGVLGANGQGKSTLIKTIAKMLLPIAGEITEGKGLSIGYFAQHELDVLKSDDTPLEHMIALAKTCVAEGKINATEAREQDLRNFLGSFSFSGEMVAQMVGSMSGGEKARLVLCMLVWQRPNLLLLDEPTNHLDLVTREALAVALNEFEGTLMLVSHDRALLRSTCDEFWLVSKGGISSFDGDMDDYQRYLLEEAKRQRESLKALDRVKGNKKAIPAENNTTKKVSKPSQKLKRELTEIEQHIPALQKKVHELQEKLSNPEDPIKISDIAQALQEAESRLHQLEERWLSIMESIESGS